MRRPVPRLIVFPLAVAGAVLFGAFLDHWYFRESPSRDTIEALPEQLTPEEALAELRHGNRRYITSHRLRSIDTAHDADDRRRLAQGQHPFVALLCCADSRLSPEFVFDQKPGSIFEVRNAGNVVDDDVMASLEYAVEHLHVPLVIVLGHTGCGAIAAVHNAGDTPLPHHLRALQEHMRGIRPESLRHLGRHDSELLDRLALVNAKFQAEDLMNQSEPIRQAVKAGHSRLLYGIYHLDSGIVELEDLK
ncbi:MAG: hypothetical protein N2039_03970 [Gemmataceae bacterium]|nr:hypothetical protein [Gemmataceae bacterium]